VEKPIADTLADAVRICDASATAACRLWWDINGDTTGSRGARKQIVDEGNSGGPYA
jgi:predicted dehydrogenase